MNKNIKIALTGIILFMIQWGILAGISIAHDNGAFQDWYRSVFRHPRLIALISGVLMAIILMVLYKPKKVVDVVYFSAPILVFNIVLNGVIHFIHYVVGGKGYFRSYELGFWADRLMFIFNCMVLVLIVVIAIMMFAATTKERRNLIITGAVCGASMWGLSTAMDWFDDIMYDTFDITPITDLLASNTLVGIILVCAILFLIPFLVIKIFKPFKSYKQLALFMAAAFAAEMFIYHVLDCISWWDGADDGLGLGFASMFIFAALIALYIFTAVDMAITGSLHQNPQKEINA